tara:strand:- start:82474 stop:82818 length:345 start_codon:yes stop_codon:yes gene_type:complete
MDAVDITTELIDGVLVLSPAGRLDSNNAALFEDKLVESIEKGEKAVIIDFAKTSYISSGGLRVIIAVSQRLDKAQEKMVLACSNPTLLQLFKISGFEMLFTICESVEDALKACE